MSRIWALSLLLLLLLLLFFFFFAFCKLARRQATSPKHEASAERELLPGGGDGWSRIFTTGLTIMGLHFQQSY